jgi:DNA-binding CsgD family transcriptional regulator
VDEAARRRHTDALIERCYVGLDAVTLRGEVLRRLRAVVSVDAAFFATLDPVTLLFTSVASEQPLIEVAGLFLDNEFGARDVNRFADLAVAADPLRSLDAATAGEREASVRYREIMAPLALGDELRVVLRAAGHSWGVMCLHREQASAGFDDKEIALVRRIGPHIAEGMRRALVADTAADGPPLEAGIGIVVLDADLSVQTINAAAESWLARIREEDWPTTDGLPLVVQGLATELVHAEVQHAAQEPEVRLRTSTGHWLSIRATWLHGDGHSQIAIVLEPATAGRVASMLFAARGLTPAQERVAAQVLQGRDTRQIMAELHISQHTVQQHLKSVFDKFGVRSRRELVASLLGH